MRFFGVRVSAVALLLCSMPALAHAETLREALTSAYANNPQILSALLNVKATAEGIAAAKSEKLPTIGAAASLTENYTFGGPAPAATGTVDVSYGQTIFDNFKSDADIEGARALTEASRYSLQNSEQNVLLAVVQAYFNVIEFTQLVELRQQNVKFFEAQKQSATDRLKIGEGTKIDVSQADARLAQGTAAYQSAIASLQSARATYEQYVGHKPRNLAGSYKIGSLMPKNLDSAVTEAVASHPAILGAKAAIRAAQAGSDAANAAFGPTLSATASIGSTLFGGPPGTTPTPKATLGFNLAVPIYSGGRMGSTIRKANITEVKSEVDAMAARDQVKQALITAWGTLQNASAQIASANTAVASGQLALDGIVQERDVGQATTLDVLNAQSELEATREGLIQATAGKAIASFAVVAATGHLTAADLGLNVELNNGEDYVAKVEDVWAELRSLK